MTESFSHSPADLYLWYRPTTSVDPTGLVWNLRYRTYNPTTHEVGFSNQPLIFPDYGINSPRLARALVALTEIQVLTGSRLQHRLEVFQAHPRASMINDKTKNPVSAFIRMSSEDDSWMKIHELGNSRAPLTRGTLEAVAPTIPANTFVMFDRIARHPNVAHSIETFDSYVTYYNGSRVLILNEAEKTVRTYAGKLSEDEMLQLTNTGEYDKGFKAYLALLKDFVSNYAVLSKKLKPDFNASLRKLMEIYAGELANGIRFLFIAVSEGATINPHNKRVHTYSPGTSPFTLERIMLGIGEGEISEIFRSSNQEPREGKIGIADSTTGEFDMFEPGQCPFFVVGFIDPKVHTKE